MDKLITTNDMNVVEQLNAEKKLGAYLRKTRENLRLTEKEAAARLNLNTHIIRNIEEEIFFQGPPVTFLRGYIRSYARLLNIPEAEINAAMDETIGQEVTSFQRSKLMNIAPLHPPKNRYLRGLTYLIVLTLISLVAIWWSSHSKFTFMTELTSEEHFSPSPKVTTAATSLTSTPSEPKEEFFITEKPNHSVSKPLIEENPVEQSALSHNSKILSSAEPIRANVNRNPKIVSAIEEKSPIDRLPSSHKNVISSMALALPEPG